MSIGDDGIPGNTKMSWLEKLELDLLAFYLTRKDMVRKERENAELQRQADSRPAYVPKAKPKRASKQIKTFDEGKDKEVLCGYLKSGVFYRQVKPEHYMRKTKSYAIQEEKVQELVRDGCELIFLEQINQEYAVCLISELKDWLAKDIRVYDHGHGKQRHYPINRMIVSTKGRHEFIKTRESVTSTRA